MYLDEFSGSKTLSFNSNVKIIKDKNNLLEISSGSSIIIRLSGDKIELQSGRNHYSGNSFLIKQVGLEDFQYDKKLYKGEIKFSLRNNKILAINIIDVEEYLKGVIFAEMGVASGPNDGEALKAFTVCARNYTYMKMDENKPDFDIYSDTRDQVYSGAGGDRSYINNAVKETNGLVLMHNNQLAKTFYYSSCGGHTEDGENVFSIESTPYLRSVEDGQSSYCSISPSFSWIERYSDADIIKYLHAADFIDDVNFKLISMKILSRFPSGRINELEIIVSENGNKKQVLLKGNHIRSVIRSAKKGILKSTLCSIEMNGTEVIIKGNGFGHGVGFCQWGAIGQSRKGRNYKEIIYSYFPGTRLEKIVNVKLRVTTN